MRGLSRPARVLLCGDVLLSSTAACGADDQGSRRRSVPDRASRSACVRHGRARRHVVQRLGGGPRRRQRLTAPLNPGPTDGFTGRAAAVSATRRFCVPSYPTAADLATAPLCPGRRVQGPLNRCAILLA